MSRPFHLIFNSEALQKSGKRLQHSTVIESKLLWKCGEIRELKNQNRTPLKCARRNVDWGKEAALNNSSKIQFSIWICQINQASRLATSLLLYKIRLETASKFCSKQMKTRRHWNVHSEMSTRKEKPHLTICQKFNFQLKHSKSIRQTAQLSGWLKTKFHGEKPLNLTVNWLSPKALRRYWLQNDRAFN